MPTESTAPRDVLPPDTSVIEVHVASFQHMFNTMDPSPFHDRDLDPDAEEFIVSWSRELPRKAKLGLRIRLDQPMRSPQEMEVLRDGIHRFFDGRSVHAKRRLKQLLRTARSSLLIGLTFLGVTVAASQLVVRFREPSAFTHVLREGLLISGWVAMWRPLELLLYDWWPIRADARLFRRLATMPVQVEYGVGAAADQGAKPAEARRAMVYPELP